MQFSITKNNISPKLLVKMETGLLLRGRIGQWVRIWALLVMVQILALQFISCDFGQFVLSLYNSLLNIYNICLCLFCKARLYHVLLVLCQWYPPFSPFIGLSIPQL